MAETIPGGRYLVGGRLVNAAGESIVDATPAAVAPEAPTPAAVAPAGEPTRKPAARKPAVRKTTKK